MDVRRLMFWRKPDQWSPEDSNLYQHALRELKRTDLLDDDGGLYGDMLGKAVLELVEVFAKQGHSGMSANATLQIFNKVANFDVLTPLTFEPDQWVVHDYNVWQHRRKSSVFSDDQGARWYDLDETEVSGERIYHDIPVNF